MLHRTLLIQTLALALACVAAHAQRPIFEDVTERSLPAFAFENGTDVAAADIDKDGDLDLIVANEGSANVILLNDGRGRFSEAMPRSFPQVARSSQAIAVADFDRDGDADIIIVSNDRSGHSYYVNDGRGVFTQAGERLPRSRGNAVAAADLTSDGAVDLVIGNNGQDMLLVNDGRGNFIDETATRLPADSSVTWDIALADVDRDGDLDMITGTEDTNRLLLNDGSGHFTDETMRRMQPSSRVETRKIAVGDVDGDGDLDIYFANVSFLMERDPQDRLFINNGLGYFADETITHLMSDPEHTTEARFADIDGDGDLDLITGNYPMRKMRAFINDGGRLIEREEGVFSNLLDAATLGLVFADLDGDGLLDLYVCNDGQRDRLYLHSPMNAVIPK